MKTTITKTSNTIGKHLGKIALSMIIIGVIMAFLSIPFQNIVICLIGFGLLILGLTIAFLAMIDNEEIKYYTLNK